VKSSSSVAVVVETSGKVVEVVQVDFIEMMT
jgi:hypothetical protein